MLGREADLETQYQEIREQELDKISQAANEFMNEETARRELESRWHFTREELENWYKNYLDGLDSETAKKLSGLVHKSHDQAGKECSYRVLNEIAKTVLRIVGSRNIILGTAGEEAAIDFEHKEMKLAFICIPWFWDHLEIFVSNRESGCCESILCHVSTSIADLLDSYAPQEDNN